jgi:Protein of unknown function (DUF541)
MDRLGTPRTLIARRRAGLLVPALAILLGGCSAAATPSSAPKATTPASAEMGAPSIGAAAASVIGPAIAPVPNGSPTSAGSAGAGSSGSGSASSAIAYPYPGLGGSAGLAPDHELVVSGTGWATVKVDLSNRVSAQRSALAAALADAKSQAQAAASDAGVTLGGVVSLSVSVGGNYYVMPMGVVEPPVTAPSTGAATAVPPATTGSAPSAPTTEQLEVTVTVAYSIS